MKMLHDLKDMLCEELDEIVEKGTLNAGDLDIVDKLTHSIKSIDTIIMYKEHDGYSHGGATAHDDYYPLRTRIDGTSYRRSRRRGRNNNPTGINQYSHEGDREHLISKMEEMLDRATPEEQRIIRKCIDELNI